MQASHVDVSVIIPCHNYSHFLPEAIASALNQERINVEVIVVDDGSTDHIQSVLRQLADPRLRSIHQAQRGIGAARNAGAELAAASMLAFLDADDLWRGDRLIRAVTTIKNENRDHICFAMLQEFLDSSIASSTQSVPLIRKVPGISASSCVVSREIFLKVGRFDETLESGEFIDWYVRAQHEGISTYVDPEVLIYRRIHSTNRDRQRRASSKEYARILMRKIKLEQGRL